MTMLSTWPVPAFTDFLLLAVIMSLYHLAGILEILTFKKTALGNAYEFDMRGNSTLALMGAAVTIGCGFLASNMGEVVARWLIVVPIFLSLAWSYSQLRRSKLLTFDTMADWLKKIIKDEVMIYARKKCSFSLIDIRKEYLSIVKVNVIFLQMVDQAGRLMPSRSFSRIIEPLLFRKTTLPRILKELTEDGELKFEDGKFIYTGKSA